MPDLSRIPLRELQQRYLVDKQPVSSHALKQLRKDPRHGVRLLYRQLHHRRVAEKAEILRTEELLHFERLLWKSGLRYVAGVDEVGVGPMAGPVVAAAVVFPPEVFICGIDDSKKVDSAKRRALEAEIRRQALAVEVAAVDVDDIDSLNIYHASVKAMKDALAKLTLPFEHVLVDAKVVPDLRVPQSKFNKGDGLSFSIAAASIVAKTCRDRMMLDLEARYPGYGFAAHKGYCTRVHQQALAKLGPCPAHRRSFLFINEVCGDLTPLFYSQKQALSAAANPEELAAAERQISQLEKDLSEYERRKLRLVANRLWSKFEN